MFGFGKNFKFTKKIKNRVFSVTFMQWIGSYLSVLFIPVIISTIMYSGAKNIISDNISKQKQYTLTQIQTYFDNLIENSTNIANQLTLDSDFNRFLGTREFNNTNRYEANAAIDKLSVLMTTNNDFDALFVYMNNTGNILTYSSMVEKTQVANYMKSVTPEQTTLWNEIISGKRFAQPFLLTFNPIGIRKSDMICMALPVTYSNKTNGIVFVGYDKNKILNAIKKLDNHSHFAVFSGNSGLVLSTFDNPESEKALTLEFIKNAKLSEFKYNEKDYDVSISDSNLFNIKYLTFTPKRLAFYEANFFTPKYLILIVIATILGGILAWMFSNSNYRHLIELFKSIGAENMSDGYVNEYALLQDKIENIIEEKRSIESRLDFLSDDLKTNFIEKVVSDRNISDITAINNSAKDFGFIHDTYAVIIFHAYDYELFAPANNEEDKQLFFFIIKNIYEELLGRKYIPYVCNIHDMLSCIVNIPENDTEFENELKNVYSISRIILKDNFGFDVSLAISGKFNGVHSLNSAFKNAMSVYDYMTFKQLRDIFFYDEINSSANNPAKNMQIYNIEPKLEEYVKNADIKKIEETLNSMLDEFMSLGIDNMDIIRNAIFTTATSLVRLSKKFDAPVVVNYTQLSYMTVSAAFEFLLGEFRILCNKIPETKSDLIDNICDFIAKNYSNPDINVAYIASNLNYNSNYISKYFKNVRQENLLDYINKTRIEKAKQLLIEKPDMPIEQVAEAVGYINSHALIRSFKKYMNTTPGKYRDENL